MATLFDSLFGTGPGGMLLPSQLQTLTADQQVLQMLLDLIELRAGGVQMLRPATAQPTGFQPVANQPTFQPVADQPIFEPTLEPVRSLANVAPRTPAPQAAPFAQFDVNAFLRSLQQPGAAANRAPAPANPLPTRAAPPAQNTTGLLASILRQGGGGRNNQLPDRSNQFLLPGYRTGRLI